MPVTGQLGFKSESAWGTPVTVDTFHNGYVSDNPVVDQAPIVSNAIRGNRSTVACVSAGTRTVSGPLSLELNPQPLATLLTHMFGTVDTAGTEAPYTHTATPSTNDPEGFTSQVGIQGGGGTVFPFTYSGCRLTGWSLSATAGEYATIGLDVIAKDYGTATALASASYGTFCPFSFVHGSISVDGNELADVNSFTLAATIPRRVKHGVGGSLIMEPRLNGDRSFEITAEVEFEDLVLHNLANTQVETILTFDNGSETFTITTNTWVNPSTPNTASGDSENTYTFTGMCMGDTDGDAITAVLVNDESSAA